MKKVILLLVFALFAITTIFAQKTEQETSEKASVKDAMDLVITNDPQFPILLQEFYDSAIYYKVDFGPQLMKLKTVMAVSADFNFIASATNDGANIAINSELLKYPKLLRSIFFRQLGKMYGLKDSEKGHDFMGTCWRIDAKHNYYAEELYKRHSIKKEYFEALALEKPLEPEM